MGGVGGRLNGFNGEVSRRALSQAQPLMQEAVNLVDRFIGMGWASGAEGGTGADDKGVGSTGSGEASSAGGHAAGVQDAVLPSPSSASRAGQREEDMGGARLMQGLTVSPIAIPVSDGTLQRAHAHTYATPPHSLSSRDPRLDENGYLDFQLLGEPPILPPRAPVGASRDAWRAVEAREDGGGARLQQQEGEIGGLSSNSLNSSTVKSRVNLSHPVDLDGVVEVDSFLLVPSAPALDMVQMVVPHSSLAAAAHASQARGGGGAGRAQGSASASPPLPQCAINVLSTSMGEGKGTRSTSISSKIGEEDLWKGGAHAMWGDDDVVLPGP